MGTPKKQRDQALEFLRLLFSMKAEAARILIWVKGTTQKISYWPSTVEEAARIVAEASIIEGADVYVGAGTAGRDHGPRRRCKEAEITSITALWIDIDFLDPAHKKKNLPPDLDAALALLKEATSIPPTLIIISGHGIQAWWLLDQPWKFSGQAGRDKAKEVLRRWQAQFKRAGAAHGWDVDSTHDLARVYRIPGTTNYKRQPYQPVEVLQMNPDQRLPLEGLDALVPLLPETPARGSQMALAAAADGQPPARQADQPGAAQGQPAAEGLATGAAPVPEYFPPDNLLIKSDATVDALKLEALLEIDPKIKKTWEKKRVDLGDTSASAYDLALGTFAFRFGWTDQEIVNLIIAFRRKHSEDLKLRSDYYLKFTLPAIHRGQQQAAAINMEVAADLNENLEMLATCIGIRIKTILKMLSSPPSFLIRLEDGREVMVGEVTGLIDQKLLRKHLANSIGYYLPSFKNVQWDKIAPKLLAICEDVDVGADATDVGSTLNWLREYVREQIRAPHDQKVQRDQALEGAPAYLHGAVQITLDHFRRFIDFRFSERKDNRALAVLLKRVGCISSTISLRGADTASGVTSRNMWTLPAEYFTPQMDGQPAENDDQIEAVH